ncbi:ASCH domain-containing protein [Streptomyces sp. NBC_00654]|uniref:ASCH domain-containing protein n=1 Tax=Streptomyces sp. NBC_00654 TaxID=2975799 RepID=UPI002250C98E|nr:ASCH domain-containing protein [Streptomyces sp. NBC_00654]MCX4970795.1 ASCH domain-containing protein [Streptomyces sp. NBC_00654]
MSAATLPEGDWIRGISIKQPYAAAILAGAKTVENRTARWRTGWVLLHTSRTIDQPALRVPLISRTIRDRALVTGAVVGIARITDCHQDPAGAPPCTEWAQPNAWHLVLDDIQELPLPIPARGQLGPWRPSPDLLSQVFQQLPDFRP